jgi:hypothetical protein
MVVERFVDLWRTKKRGRKEDGSGSTSNSSVEVRILTAI